MFVEGRKPENPEKNPRSRDENQQQTQLTCDAGSENRTRATAVGGECSHHCAITEPSRALVYLETLNVSIKNLPLLGKRFAITATSAALLANLIPLIVDMMLGASPTLLVAAAEVRDVIRGSGDV